MRPLACKVVTYFSKRTWTFAKQCSVNEKDGETKSEE